MPNPRIFTIDPDGPFAESLASHVMSRLNHDPLALSSATILIPTQRARRPLETAFLRLTDGVAALLPSIHAVADAVDLAEGLSLTGLAGLAGGDLRSDSLDVLSKPTMAETERRSVLAKLIAAWSQLGSKGEDRPALAPAQAWRLAAQLGSFLDELNRHDIPTDKVVGLVDGEHASHWQRIIGFLNIVLEQWPAILSDRGLVDRAQVQEAALATIAQAITAGGLSGPVFAAGSTGSRPGVRKLLAAIARADNGEVILPGLDIEMPDDVWQNIPAQHPQAPLKDLLESMSVSRFEVQMLPAFDGAYLSTVRAPQARLSLLRDAMAPAAQTANWANSPWRGEAAKDALRGLRLAVGANRREEAQIIAIAMREALETPGRTAALITPDRSLAEYVRLALSDWGIVVDDSAGQAARLSLPGRLLLLLGEAVSDDLTGSMAPVKLLALLQHPLVSLGRARTIVRQFVRKLDKYILRGPRPAGGFAALDILISEHKRFDSDDLNLWRDISAILRPFAEMLTVANKPVDLLAAHLRAAEALCAPEDADQSNDLWAHDAGRSLAQYLADLLAELGSAAAITGASWAALFDALLEDCTVRPSFGQHPRLSILGQIEARMQWADLMILGGLYDGSWPAELPADPWMNRQMRSQLGLPPVESRLALSTHDFIQAASAPDVLLTYPAKVDGTPVVPSRFIYRLEALTGEKLPHATELEDWAIRRHQAPARSTVAARAAFAPPLDARPNRLAVTDVQLLMQDPYALYAKKILALKPLDPIDQNPNAAQKGTVLHDALEVWVRDTMDRPHVRLTEEGRALLTAAGEAAFKVIDAYPGVRAFWWPRFQALVDQVLEHGAAWWATHETLAVETWGSWQVPGADFEVYAKADRIDRDGDGKLVVIDYKTGMIPSQKVMRAGFAPQLPLEGVIAEAGGFDGVVASEVGDLQFWKITGGEKGIERKPSRDVPDLIAEAASGVARLVAHFQQAGNAYISQPRAAYKGRGDYDHLARVAEWRGNPQAQQQQKQSLDAERTS